MLRDACSPESALGVSASLMVEPSDHASSTTKRIIFVNRYFFPDHSATSQILSDLAFYLAGCGHAVRVFAGRQRYDDPHARLPETERRAGVDVSRLSTTRFGRSRLVGRGFDYVSFYASAWRSVLAAAQPGDILVVKTDPPLLCIPAMHVAKRRGLHLVNWLQDLYPEVATKLGVPFVNGPVAQGLMRLRDAALRQAKANVVVGDRMAEILRARGISGDRIHVIPNWCDDEEIRPVDRHDNPLRSAWSLEDKFVVGYSGNLGRAHEYDTVLAAAERLRDVPHMVFLFIGGGAKFDELARAVRERKLDPLFRFLPYQERAALKYSLSVPDVHLISLKPELEGLIVPSKFYGIAAAGRPMIAVTAADGEFARHIQQYHCGTVVEPGAGDQLAATLRSFSSDRRGLQEMGQRARTMLEGQFTRAQAFERWRRLLESIA